MTNDLSSRLFEHFENRGKPETFAGRFYCYQLIYYERYEQPQMAIDREKQIKRWTRAKKEKLIATRNPEWFFLNNEVIE